MDKNCLFCKWFSYSMGELIYSEYAPGYTEGSNAEIYCAKQVWNWQPFDDTEYEFKQKMLSARQCDIYEVVEVLE